MFPKSSDPPLSGPDEIAAFQRALTGWFHENGRSYPWRETTDPYPILVSELMLQQTRIETVLERNYFQDWLREFPDWETLARAPENRILKRWEGLGYYNRARNLQKAAQLIVADHGGVFPRSIEAIRELPGVGPYTAGAVLSFAFDQRAPIVDGNVIRVLSRVFAYEEPVDSTRGRKQIDAWAESLTPHADVRSYNSGIMELGQRICRRGEPDCLQCPVSPWCRSSGSDLATDLPRKGKSVRITEKTEKVLLWIRDDRVRLSREDGSRRKGLWRLPHLDEAWLPICDQNFEISYQITRYRVLLQVFSPTGNADFPEECPGTWFPLDKELPPLGAPYLKAIRTQLPPDRN